LQDLGDWSVIHINAVTLRYLEIEDFARSLVEPMGDGVEIVPFIPVVSTAPGKLGASDDLSLQTTNSGPDRDTPARRR